MSCLTPPFPFWEHPVAGAWVLNFKQEAFHQFYLTHQLSSSAGHVVASGAHDQGWTPSKFYPPQAAPPRAAGAGAKAPVAVAGALGCCEKCGVWRWWQRVVTQGLVLQTLRSFLHVSPIPRAPGPSPQWLEPPSIHPWPIFSGGWPGALGYLLHVFETEPAQVDPVTKERSGEV